MVTLFGLGLIIGGGYLGLHGVAPKGARQIAGDDSHFQVYAGHAHHSGAVIAISAVMVFVGVLIVARKRGN